MALDNKKKDAIKFCTGVCEKAHRTSRISACLDEALDYLCRTKVSQLIHLLPTQVCTHPQNRDKNMLNGETVHTLIDDIASVGAIKKKVEAVCTDATDDDIALNVQLVNQSNGRLGSIEAADVTASALASSHFTSGCVCFHRQVAHDNPNITVDGMLNISKLRAWDPVYADLVEFGYDWTRVPRWLFDNVPEMLWLVQAGKNVHVAQGEQQIQLAERIFDESNRHMNPDGKVSYDAVKGKILMTKPDNPECVPHMFKFVNANCAGADPFMLRQTKDFVRANCSFKHKIGVKEWQVLADEKPWLKKTSRFRWGLIEYMYYFGDCVLADIKKMHLAAMQKDIELADNTMNQFRKIFSQCDARCIRYIGLAEVHITAATLGLKSAMHKNMYVVAHFFFEQLKATLGVEVESPYKSMAMNADADFFKEKPTATATTQASSSDAVMNPPCAHVCINEFVCICYVSWIACLT